MKTKLQPVDHPGARRVVSRLHVAVSPLDAARAVRKSLKWGTLDHTHRRYAIAAAIQAHAHNILEYRAVQSGQLSLLSRWRPRYFFNPDTLETTIRP